MKATRIVLVTPTMGSWTDWHITAPAWWHVQAWDRRSLNPVWTLCGQSMNRGDHTNTDPATHYVSFFSEAEICPDCIFAFGQYQLKEVP